MCNIQGGRKNALHYRSQDTTHTLATGGVFTSGNTNRIHRLNADGTWSSYRHGRAINGFTTMPKADGIAGPLAGRMYLIDAVSDIDFMMNDQIPLWVCDEGTEVLTPTTLADDVTPWVWNDGSDKIPNFALFSGTVVNSTQSGNWSSSSTWGGSTPAAGNIIRIRSGHTVTYDQNNTTSYKVVSVENGGTLAFSVAASTNLRFQHGLVRETGKLTIGTPAAPVPNGTAATVEFADVALDTTNDPAQFGNGLVVLGTLQVCGYDRGNRYVRVTAELAATNTVMPLASAVSNWQVGDSVLVPDTRQFSTTETMGDRHELRTISGFNGGKTAVNVSALTYAHGGPYDDAGTLETAMLFHVVNLSSNVTFRSVDVTGVPGHVVCVGRADVDVRHASFYELTRTRGDVSLDNTTFLGDTATHIGTNQIGKYPLHLHHVGGRATPVNGGGYQFRVTGCVFHGGTDLTHFRKWGLTTHGSHFGLIQNNVCYNTFGGGFVFEDGSETGNTVDANVAGYIRGYAGREDADNSVTGFARNGGGFWMRSGLNRFTANVAFNCAAYGQIVNCISVSPVDVPTYKGARHMDGTVMASPFQMGSRTMDGFEIYACNGGVTYWNWNFISFYTPPYTNPWIELKNYKVWHIPTSTMYGYPGSHITFKDWTVRGDINRLTNDSYQRVFTWHDDYRCQNLKVTGCDVQGCKIGVELSPDIYDQVLIEDCTITCGVGVMVLTPVAVGAEGPDNSAPTQRERLVTIRGCTLTPTSRSVNASFVPTKYEVNMLYGPYGGTYGNNVVKGQCFVYSRNGSSGADFQVYHPDQASTYVMRQSTSQLYECPEAGLTNTQAHAKYVPWQPGMTGLNIPVKSDNPNPNTPGLAFSGEVAPGSAATPSWSNGLARAL